MTKRQITVAVLKRAVLVAASLPALAVGILATVLGLALFLTRSPKWNAADSVFEATWRDWVGKRWRYSNACGRALIWHPGMVGDDRIRRHELVHVRQSEDQCSVALLVGIGLCFVSPVAALVVWCSAPAWNLVSLATAWLRGGHPYWDAEHERSAYAQIESGFDRGVPR